MGILPLTFKNGATRQTLGITGDETIAIRGLSAGIKPRMDVELVITRKDGSQHIEPLLCRIDTLDELAYYQNGGILQYVMRNLLTGKAA